jgi:glycine/D-amino acid oxidase-like deaminating enzyme
MAGRSGAVDLRFRPWHEPRDGRRHRALWIEDALAREAPEPPNELAGEQQFDICIVGGGFTGLWTANRLRELDAGASIAVVEADLCGSGASGRNSGGMGHWWSKLPSLLRVLGNDDAMVVLNKSVDILDDIRTFVTQQQIQCELRRGPSVWTATARAHVGAWDGVLRAAEKVGLPAPYRTLSVQELRAMFGRGPYYAGVVEDDATRVQPALLARGLRRTAIGRGVTIFERSPVTDIRSDRSGVIVKTGRGQIVAQKVVLAANAWMAHLAEFRSSVMVVSSDIVITAPIPELIKQHGLQNRPGSRNSRLMLNYGGITPEGRVYLGRGGGTLAYDAHIGPEFDYSPGQAADIVRDFRYLYPELGDVPMERGWAGPIDRSTTGLPWFGQLADERIHYAIGYAGHGVAASAMAGRALAADLLGRSDEWTAVAACLLRMRQGRFPPEPIRYLAGRVVRAGVARKERAEHDGRAPSWLDKQLARLAPATVTDVFRRRST